MSTSVFDVPVDEKPVAALARRAWSPVDARLSRGRQVVAVGILLVVLGATARGWLSHGSWFSGRDFGFIATATLDEPGTDRAMPVASLLADLVASSGFGWPAYATQMVVLQSVAALACLWMLCVVFGARALTLVPLTWYLLAPLTLPASLSWSTAIHQWPAHIAMFAAIGLYALWLRHRSAAVAGVAVFAYGLALVSDTRSMVVLAPLAVLALTWPGSGSRGSRWWVESGPWTGFAALTVLYGLWRFATDAPFWQSVTSRSEGLADAFATIGPVLLGGPWVWSTTAAPQAESAVPSFWVIAAWLLLVALSSLAIARRPPAVHAVAAFVLAASLSVALTLTDRGGSIGLGTLSDVSSYAELAVVGAFVIALALMSLRTTAGSAEKTHSVGGSPSPFLAPVVCLAVLLAVGVLITGLRGVQPWHTTDDPEAFPERAYVDAVTELLDDADVSPVTVLDTAVPEAVAPMSSVDDRRLSRFLAPLNDALQPVSSGIELQVLTDDLDLGPAYIPGDPSHAPGPVPDCGFLVQNEAVTVRLAPTAATDPWIAVDYIASEDGIIDVYTRGDVQQLPITGGLGTLWMRGDHGLTQITVATQGDLTVCADSIRIGEPAIRTWDDLP